MVEDTKEKTPSQQTPSEAEKKQPIPTPVASAPRPAAAAPAPQPPRQPAVPPKPPAAPVSVPKSQGRRTFVKAMVTVGALLGLAPFVPWGSFLTSSVSSTGALKRQKLVLDLNTAENRNANGAVAGQPANVKDLSSFPANGSWLFTYPSSGDLTLDSNNPDTFQKFQLIRLPNELGGASQSAASFVAYSKVCVHLWCSPSYDPGKSTNPADETYQCPCHGSIYQLPQKGQSGGLVDGGLAIHGPASLQAPPTNAIPMLTLTADPATGDLYVEVPEWDVDHNGVIGYGRNYQSYQNYILPAAEGKS